MARKASRKGGRGEKQAARRGLVISKNRIKAAAGMHVAGDFYGALDTAVRRLIAAAEKRALENGRRTLRPHDL
jgi:hypothetical protein